MASVVLVASCKKDDEVSKKDQTMDSLLGKATISGIVYLERDATSKGLERAGNAEISVSLADTLLAYKVEKSSITYNADKVFTTKTNDNGEFTISVDANTESLTYSVKVGQFAGSFKHIAGRYILTGKDSIAEPKAYFEAAAQPVNLRKGETQFVRFDLVKTITLE